MSGRAHHHWRAGAAYPLMAAMSLWLPLLSIAQADSLRSLRPGGRVESFPLRSTHGDQTIWSPGAPTVFVIWANWSPQSLVALTGISRAAARAALHWDVMPINVDQRTPGPQALARMDSLAHKAGMSDPVYFDPDLELFSRWGVVTVPSIIVCRMDGTVEMIVDRWEATTRDRLVHGFLGTLQSRSDSVPVDTMATCHRQLEAAAALWRYGSRDSAVTLAKSVGNACPQFATPHVLMSQWYWESCNPTAAGREARAAVHADSEDVWGWSVLAALCQRQGQSDSARIFGSRALACDSDFAPAWLTIAQADLAVGDTASTRTTLQALDHLNQHLARAEVARATLYEERGDRARAATSWRRAVEMRLGGH